MAAPATGSTAAPALPTSHHPLQLMVICAFCQPRLLLPLQWFLQQDLRAHEEHQRGHHQERGQAQTGVKRKEQKLPLFMAGDLDVLVDVVIALARSHSLVVRDVVGGVTREDLVALVLGDASTPLSSAGKRRHVHDVVVLGEDTRAVVRGKHDARTDDGAEADELEGDVGLVGHDD